MSNGTEINPGPSERVIMADAALSNGGNMTDRTKNRYKGIRGGWSKAHDTGHMNGRLPSNGAHVYLDGHAERVRFQKMVVRTDGTEPHFWW